MHQKESRNLEECKNASGGLGGSTVTSIDGAGGCRWTLMLLRLLDWGDMGEVEVGLVKMEVDRAKVKGGGRGHGTRRPLLAVPPLLQRTISPMIWVAENTWGPRLITIALKHKYLGGVGPRI